MPESLKFIEQVFLGNSLRDWLLAALVFVTTFLVLPFIRGRIRARQQKWRDTHNPLLELLARLAGATRHTVVLSVALYLAEKLLKLPPKLDRAFEVIIVAGIAVQMALWAVAALRFAIERYYSKHAGGEPGTSAAVGVMMFVGQVVIWAVFALLALDNLGINITALVAGLGIGGIAIALAVQTVLGDLLGSLSIALDKPFVVGDALRIDDVEGTVEHIGIKSTHLRSVTGEQVILSNADVLRSRVRNLGRMPEKRVQFRIGVTYETPSGKVDAAAGIVRRVIEAVPDTRFVQCALLSLGADSLEFEVVYFIANRADVNLAGAQDAVNRGILREFAAAGISFAYATRRVLLEQGSGA